MSDFLKDFLKAIPEAGYDLIARILPGGIIIAAAASTEVPLVGLKVTGALSVQQTVVFLAFGYAVGLAISSLIHIFHFITWPLIYRFLHLGKIDGRLVESLTQTNCSDEDSMILKWNAPSVAQAVLGRAHDIIKHMSPRERPVVVKLVAEVTLLYGLAMGSLVALLIIHQLSIYWIVPIVFLIAAIFRSFRTWSRHATILGALLMPPKIAEPKARTVQ